MVLILGLLAMNCVAKLRDEYLTKKEVARLLRVSCRTIEVYTKTNKLPIVRVSPRRVLYPIDALSNWLLERTTRG